MDQIVVHLSINHATLPRIQNFLSHLQIGPMSLHMTKTQNTAPTSRVRNTQPDKSQTNGHKAEPTTYKALNSLYNRLTGTISRSSSISEQPLRYRQERGIELSTIVYAGKGELDQQNAQSGRSAATSLSSDDLNREESSDQGRGVRMQKDISVTYNHM
jgi:hypothetical protein